MKDGRSLDWTEARARVERARERIERRDQGAANRDRILLERAERLARPAAAVPEGRTETILVAAVGDERFGIPLAAVLEVARSANCTPAPLAPSRVAGLIQVRGEIRPVFHVFGGRTVPRRGPDDFYTVLLIRAGRGEAGLLVDRVEDIRQLAATERLPAPTGPTPALWMTSDLIPVLDPRRILPEEMA